MVEDEPGSIVQLVFNREQVDWGVRAEVGALREVVAQQPVHVLVRAALPGRVRVAEVDRRAERAADLQVAGHFRALVPGDRPSQGGRQIRQPCGQGIVQGLAVAAREVQQPDRPGLPFDEGADRRGLVLADNQVSLLTLLRGRQPGVS
jgi:hypothetical protein